MKIKDYLIMKTTHLMVDEIYKTTDITSNLISTAMLHKETFGPYKNFCKGERELVICGAGPSLSKYKPIQEAVHIALNRSFLYEKIKFDFIFSQDFDGIRMVQNELINYCPDTCVKFLGTQLDPYRMIPESLILKANGKKYDTDGYIPRSGEYRDIVLDIDKKPLCNMNNVGQSVMQLAFFMNPKKIYIVGCDMSGGHFTQRTQTDAERKKEDDEMKAVWNDKKRTEETLANWKRIRDFGKLHYPDTQVISINPVGLKGIFEDVYQE